MSMHDVEDMLEQAARLLDESDHPELRTMFYRLFSEYARLPVVDVGYVENRILNILAKHRYLYLLDAGEYADYQSLAYFVNKGVLHCAVGDRLWEKLAADGRLTGADAEPPNPEVGAAETIAALFIEAEKHGDRKLVGQWYAALLTWLNFTTIDRALPLLTQSAALRDLMNIVVRMEAENPDHDDIENVSMFTPPLPTTPETYVEAVIRSREEEE